MRTATVLSVGIFLAAVASCRRTPEPAPVDPLEDVFRHHAQEEGLSRSQTEGKRFFGQYCATCHGDEGHGDGQNAYNLDPKPPDFEASLGQHPSSYWRQIIEGGTASVGRSPLCPPWGRTLAGEDIDALISYLDVLGKATPPQEPSPGSPAAPAPK